LVASHALVISAFALFVRVIAGSSIEEEERGLGDVEAGASR
jgi:hypothetical protein